MRLLPVVRGSREVLYERRLLLKRCEGDVLPIVALFCKSVRGATFELSKLKALVSFLPP